MKKFTRFIALSLVLILVLSMGLGALSAQEEVVAIIAWEQEGPSLWPLVNMVFVSAIDPLVRRGVWDWRGDDTEIFPIMVEEIPTVENGLVTETEDGATAVTYRLREGMLWSDGTPITTADCATGHRIFMDVSTGDIQRGLYPEVVDRLDIIDDLTAVLVYNEPFPDYLVTATLQCEFPAHVYGPILDEVGTIDNAPFLYPGGVSELVGYGPYVFESWDIGEQATFVRNPNWGANDFEDEPAVDVVVLRFIPDAAVRRSAMEVGDVDISVRISFDLVEEHREMADVEVWQTPGVVQDAVWVNMDPDGTQHPALKDTRVREAIAHALDRQEMINALYDPNTTPPRSWYHVNWVPDDLSYLDYDPDLANELLDEAGWVDTTGDGVRDNGEGLSLTLRFFTTTLQLRMDYQLLIQQYLADVGIATQLLPVPAGILFAGFTERGIVSTGDFDLSMFALTNNPLSPNISPFWFACDAIKVPGGGNGYGFCDPRFDELTSLIATTVDPDERLALVNEQVNIMNNARFWIGMYTRDEYYAVNTTRFDPASMYDMGVLSSNFLNQVEYWLPAN
jgi:peptide/nickel transport system substrate-binding protein